MYDFNRIIDRKNTRSAKWSNPDLLPLWVADMDFEAPPGVAEAITERAKHNLYGYDRLPEKYFETLINWFEKQWFVKFKEEWIVPTSGVVEAVFFAIRIYTVPGDAVVIQPPVYHPFARSVLHSGRQLLNNPLVKSDTQYKIDFDDLEKKLADPFVKMLILCNPHNPVGRVYTADELKKIGELALKHDVIIVSDEIHGDLILGGRKHISFLGLSEEINKISVICTAPSKTFNLAGLATSNIIIPDKKLREKYAEYLQKRGIHGGNLYGFIAGEAAYRTGGQWLADLLIYLEENAKYLKNYLAENIKNIYAEDLEGTYLMWLDFRKLNLSDSELDNFIRTKAKLWLSPGRQFGEEGSGFMRVNIAAPREIIKNALERLETAVKSLS
jgi:cysteine-S-conjugate beta-lyase